MPILATRVIIKPSLPPRSSCEQILLTSKADPIPRTSQTPRGGGRRRTYPPSPEGCTKFGDALPVASAPPGGQPCPFSPGRPGRWAVIQRPSDRAAPDRRRLAPERIRLAPRTEGHSPGWYLLGVPRSCRRSLLSGSVHPAARVGRCGSSAICPALPLSASIWSRSRGDDRQSRCGTLDCQYGAS